MRDACGLLKTVIYANGYEGFFVCLFVFCNRVGVGWGDESAVKFFVVLVAQLLNILKSTEWYTLNG